MRLRYGELSEAESLARDAIRQQAAEAWSWFGERQIARACASFAKLDERLSLHVVAADTTAPARFELAVLEPAAWPLAALVLSEAPSHLAGTLALGRSAESVSEALSEVTRSHGVSLGRSSFRAGFGRGHLLEITLAIPGGAGAETEQIAAEALVRRVLGDRVFETWVGTVHAVPAPRGGPLRVLDTPASSAGIQLQDLFATVAAAACGVLSGLLPEPLASSTTTETWTLLEIEPLAPGRGSSKDDLMLASSCTPELLRCFLDGAPCSSCRFSRVGERFLYLSYADADAPGEARVARRALVEACVSEALAGFGAVTGVGLGLQTTYIDFALSDLDQGLPRLVLALRKCRLPEQSFVQFFDTELVEEWLSIWPNVALPLG